jgi:hypothetical protein
MTFVLSDGRDLYAHRDYTQAGGYYTLFYTALDDAFVIAQQPFFESRWSEVGNSQLIHMSSSSGIEVVDALPDASLRE